MFRLKRTNDIKKRFTYVTKLYNEEMQVLAPKTIKSLGDLEGKTVSVDLPNGGTFVTALTVFERLGIKANFVYMEQRIAIRNVHNRPFWKHKFDARFNALPTRAGYERISAS